MQRVIVVGHRDLALWTPPVALDLDPVLDLCLDWGPALFCFCCEA